MKYILFIIILLYNTICFSNNSDSSKFITSINFNFNNRFSYSDKNLYNIFGFKVGFTMLKRHKVGLGLNYLYTNIYDYKNINIDNIFYEIKSPLKYYFASAFYEPILYQDKHWELSIPFQLGIGNSYFSYWMNKEKIIYDQSTIINIESVISGHYKIFWWAGIGTGVGYNYNIKTNKWIDKNFNGFVFYTKIKIFLGDIYRNWSSLKSNGKSSK